MGMEADGVLDSFLYSNKVKEKKIPLQTSSHWTSALLDLSWSVYMILRNSVLMVAQLKLDFRKTPEQRKTTEQSPLYL